MAALEQQLLQPAAQHAASGQHACVIALAHDFAPTNELFWRGAGSGHAAAGDDPGSAEAAGLLLGAALALQRCAPDGSSIAAQAVCFKGARATDLLIPHTVGNSRAHKHLPAVRLREKPQGLYLQGASVQRLDSSEEHLRATLGGAWRTLEYGMSHMGTTPSRDPHSVFVSLFVLPSPQAPLTQATGRLDIFKLPHVLPASASATSRLPGRAISSHRDHGRVTAVLRAAAAAQSARDEGSARTVHVPFRDTPAARLLQCCLRATHSQTAASFWLGHVPGGDAEGSGVLDALAAAARVRVPQRQYAGQVAAFHEASPQEVAAAAKQALAEEAAAATTQVTQAQTADTATGKSGENGKQ